MFCSTRTWRIYRQRVAVLPQALEAPDGNVEAIEAVRSLIDRIVVTPTAGKLTIDLYGEIAAILCMAAGKRAADVPVSVAEQLVMVARARSHLYRTELRIGH